MDKTFQMFLHNLIMLRLHNLMMISNGRKPSTDKYSFFIFTSINAAVFNLLGL